MKENKSCASTAMNINFLQIRQWIFFKRCTISDHKWKWQFWRISSEEKLSATRHVYSVVSVDWGVDWGKARGGGRYKKTNLLSLFDRPEVGEMQIKVQRPCIHALLLSPQIAKMSLYQLCHGIFIFISIKVVPIVLKAWQALHTYKYL